MAEPGCRRIVLPAIVPFPPDRHKIVICPGVTPPERYNGRFNRRSGAVCETSGWNSPPSAAIY
jgi:hypothetical protein